MVMCSMDSPVAGIPRPPPLNPYLLPKAASGSASVSGGFRLLDSQQDDTGSVYSVYKQKIDAMFESDTSSTKNSVQARIEKMFTDVAIDNGIPVNDYGCHNFSVDYLGSVPLQEKVTSLAGLQKPLKDLYFAYKRTTKHKKTLTGRLEISAVGLKVQYQGEKGDLEQLNSFPTIAVWSAVKFVMNENTKSSYAFLPLITDPDNIDKKQLFKAMDSSERKIIGSNNPHSPLFAVVMRKIGVHKQLECHGFVCQTSEDAIVIAATLYKSLMSHMKAKEKRPKNRNGVTCMSVASTINEPHPALPIPVRPPRKKRSSTMSGGSSIISDVDTIDTETAPLLQDRSKSPKKSTKTKRAPKAPDLSDLDAILPYEEPTNLDKPLIQQPPPPLGDKWNTYKSNHQKQITAEIKQVMSESSNMGLKRVKSVRRAQEEVQTTGDNNGGDILTKVTIPRSGSFLNAGGLTRLNGQASGGSPLGFNELFNEFRLQEGLNSLDEILGVIIDPEGMSFNDLKPIYKEFLLKLAVTLTKDELYQRSKAIMRRQKKKKLMLRRPAKKTNQKKQRIVCSKFKRFKHVFKRFKSSSSQQRLKEEENIKPESTISSSSYDTQHFTPKTPIVRQSTSEESDFFSLRKSSRQINQHRNSSSGYVSCSECSFDSDTCTCVSADKCYCSLGNKINNKCSDFGESLTYCGCDTDSCADSNKCYCNRGNNINDQLNRLKNYVPPTAKNCCKRNSNTRSTKSVLEYMHNPSERYYEKLHSRRKKDYEIMDQRFLYKDHICNDGRKSVQSSGPCTEALSVKKSAEIAALFADIKLSQTTDITQILPRHHTKFPFSNNQRLIPNSLYTSGYGHGGGNRGLYSAKNGLYTIQSQSDDSSRSKSERDYFNVSKKKSQKVLSSNLENSLGYLP
ncbi:PREDICTED: uncharacterized protein LOC108564376 isoform X2 [Nicrophorus vespilloides]|uniref:Uncharacterized protein LOC108564376 isoform X2 n=1 Tax=Nicrophorus vespilloides TaxID=110193 RepID=A0ABM1MWE2_NICVS|nr:PREDICTED: uncharacterized protein LOC108564376 isoform X2 [Nicrophorus vespilloides]